MDGFIPLLIQQVDALLKLYSQEAYQPLAAYVYHPAMVLATLFIAVQGIRLMWGEAEAALWVMVKSVLRLGFLFLVLGPNGWTWVSTYLCDVLNTLTNDVGMILLSPRGTGNATTVWQGVQQLYDQFSRMGFDFFSQGHLYSPLPYLNGLIVWGVGLLITAVGVFHVLAAKVWFAILIAVLPFILLLCIFEMFQPMLERWLGFVLSVCLVQVLIYAVIAFDLQLSDWWMKHFRLLDSTVVNNASALPLIILGLVTIGLILRVSGFAYGIGAGVTLMSRQAGAGAWVSHQLWGRTQSVSARASGGER